MGVEDQETQHADGHHEFQRPADGYLHGRPTFLYLALA